MASTTRLKGCKVWRYAVERLDYEDGVVRLERVPLAKEIEVKQFVDRLAKEEKEKLEWWNTKRAESRLLSIKECRRNLHLEGQKLVENMVFWVLLKGRKGPQSESRPLRYLPTIHELKAGTSNQGRFTNDEHACPRCRSGVRREPDCLSDSLPK